MLQMFGEGELEIKNQGRFWYYSKSFSQETRAIGQQSLRISEQRPKLERELSVWKRVDSDSTPHFFLTSERAGCARVKFRKQRLAFALRWRETQVPGTCWRAHG